MSDTHVAAEPEQFEGFSRKLILGGNDFTITAAQDVAPILDFNKAAQGEDPRGWNLKQTNAGRLVARVPLIIIEKWRNELGLDWFNMNHRPAIKRLLNSNEYAYLRTTTGQIGGSARHV